MKPLFTIACMATLMTLPGCLSVTPGAADPVAPAVPGFEVGGGTLQPGLNIRVLDQLIVAAMRVESGAPLVADYIIQRPSVPNEIFHVESNNPGQSFALEVSRARFYAGTYTMKVFLDKATTPAATQTFQIP